MIEKMILRRFFSTKSSTMRAWVSENGSGVELKEVPLPVINKPGQVLLKVKAASVNPIDVDMSQGYGREFLGTWKKIESCDAAASRFPLIPGRDCTAVVESVGGDVHNLAPGDEVMAVVPVILPGTHAEFVVTDSKYCSKKPSNLSFVSAAALPYVASTAYSAFTIARVSQRNAKQQRVLIHGGAGGVGSMAIQLLKAWGCEKIVATCAKGSFDIVKQLGAIPVDYTSDQATQELIEHAPFEVILDTVDSQLAKWSDNVMGVWRNCVHVSIVSPLMREMDKNGVPLGLVTTAMKHFERSFQSHLRGRWFSYAFFRPSSDLMSQLSRFAEDGKIVPVVEQVMGFEELEKAYEKVSQLNGRGKTVIKYD
ncbi:Reticulon-4-interacting protein 1, mitochondrial [Caenorhabditis elegans]|uniref:Reticulon-4-interacting protein 1, mitochondrial n=1 Tax=Caenorhabditis elegans TaxID=6239 RepID=RT4I1_CAEEL|nr:Reticulon-4-interacting protein 1, mitochondrial [Caenorhabditis elegans]Q4W4Z2.2 RecName: Full=Reticulon-4-interacting protein 1, mitochondrial; Flags: Precursor [Caenorhabditis elegans]CCD62972.1 Reticulon-4-interacting protein 1, mitochondrial [Caenorhabditis elegans]|eukprot:NP_001021512.2 Reticulon-4-interacting protein 1, mitochondrial [Caenorhabditis elegans]